MAKLNAKRYTLNAKYYLQPAFLICTAVLAIAASGMSVAIKSFGVVLKKEPLPLKKPLDLLDEKPLAGYKVISKTKIENEEVLKSLGTRDYIQWVLEDTDESADSPVRHCMLFITYYKRPDRVPHTPEECYMGGGYQKLSSDGVILEIDKSGFNKKIPARYLVFTGTNSDLWKSGSKIPILYLFRVNGDYTNSRDGARLALNKNIRGKHSYFCKVEWNFSNRGSAAAQGLSGLNVYPNKEQALVASPKLLSVILPVLEDDHWPDWQ